MKKITIILSFCLLLLNSFVNAQNIKAYLSYSKFLSPTGPYVETYLSIVGNTVSYTKNDSGKFQGMVEITLIFKEKDTIRYFDKYDLLSPQIDDTGSIKINFIDIQRIPLKNGVYDFEINIADKNKKGRSFSHKEIIIMNFSDDNISISDIQFIESYEKSTKQNILTKSGYNLIPYISNFFPQTVNKLIFYGEIYNSSKVLGDNEKYLVNYFIESYETEMPLSKYKRFVRQNTRDVNVVFSEFNIEELISGNYNLVFEIRSRENELIANKKIFFQRSNPGIKLTLDDFVNIDINETFTSKYTDKEVLSDYIRSLLPISSETERIFQDNRLKSSNLELMQKYFLHFWKKRNSLNPENAWKTYQKQIKKVNDEFRTGIKKGYETDRGRVYLQYGQPNSISKVDHEPSSYPYEIWHYYKVTNQTNVKFVFMDNDLAMNDYILIHSDVFSELSDRRWHYKTQKRNTPRSNIEREKGVEHYGGKSLEYYNNPR